MTTDATLVKETFEALEQKAKDPNISDDELKSDLVDFLNKSKYERTAYKMTFTGFHRARAGTYKSIEKACEGFGNVKLLRYPPDEHTSPSRCNFDKHSVFYGSTNSGVPIFEIRPSIGQYVVMAGFHPKKYPFEITLTAIGVQQLYDSLSDYNPGNYLVEMLKNDIRYNGSHNLALEIDNYLSKLFTTPVDISNRHIYRLTASFYNGLINSNWVENHKVSSLIYPSVESEITGFNIAMEKELVRKNLEVKHATIYQIENKFGKEFHLRPLRQSGKINGKGNITWIKAQNNHKLWILEPDSPTELTVSGQVTGIIKNRF